jgi:uncharacterized membrane protein YcaP (DUF421 family)
MLLSIDLLGLEVKDLQWYQMLIRTVIVFIVALIFIRVSGMRTFGTQSAFDVIVVITLGGILGRCIMGHYPFFASIGAAGCITLLHKLASVLAYRSKLIRYLIEGDAVLLFKNGEKLIRKLKQYDITDQELIAAIHEQSLDSFEKVKSIWLEPDGKLSVIKKSA